MSPDSETLSHVVVRWRHDIAGGGATGRRMRTGVVMSRAFRSIRPGVAAGGKLPPNRRHRFGI